MNPIDVPLYKDTKFMPASRLISDLDHLTSELNREGTASAPLMDELRLTVARVNEFRRQLDIAQLILTSVLSLAGMKTVERQVEPGDTATFNNNRFNLPAEMCTGIANIDAAHRAIFQAGNQLYWHAMQHDINVNAVHEALWQLTQNTQNAFAIEEQMMLQSNYAAYINHRDIHQHMLDYLTEMKNVVAIQPLAVVIKLEKFLGSWFLWHRQREDHHFGLYSLHKQSEAVPSIELPTMLTGNATESAVHEEPARNPVRELGYLIRSQLSAWLLSWREKRHVGRTSRTILAQYRRISKAHPDLPATSVYVFVVMAHTGCDSSTANIILDRAEESFAEWPISRALTLRDVVHYLTVTEYLDLYGKDFWMRSEIIKMVNANIPKIL
jgi:hemerythrin-like metal-binding protein